VYIAVIDLPHLELSLLGQGDKSVGVFGAQGWDTLYRRDAHILSALGSSLQRDRWGTRASSRVGGQIWPRSPASSLRLCHCLAWSCECDKATFCWWYKDH